MEWQWICDLGFLGVLDFLGHLPLVCKNAGYGAVEDPYCPARMNQWPGCQEHTLGDG